MKFTLSWLGNYISLDGLASDRLADRLTMLGLEVDTVEELYVGLDAIQTAKVLSVTKHPNADRLSLCEVEIGEETVPIVCGASNVRPGLITAIARPGVKLPGGMKIKKAKVRGEVSLGMLCSWRELGIGEEHAGIIELDSSLASGQSLAEVLGLSDTMIEIDLTPNRPDCTAVLGVAREVAGFTEQKVSRPVRSLPELGETSAEFTVKIAEPELCPRYAARKLTNVTIQPSPWWLQRQLLAVGMRPINNIVDITNFVMLEYGQPLHAFDFQQLAGKTIEVRCPRADESTFVTLDDTERKLEPNMLMICDADKPVAVAGVMGGLHSEVTGETTEILLESACFDPISVRRTARKLNLSTEASYRFERGINPDGVTEAMERAVQLICELGGAQVEDGVDLYPGKKELLQLDLRIERVNSLLGITLTGQEIADYLCGIDFAVAEKDSTVLAVTVPPFRVDIEREVDLVEELARLVGYNEIPTTLPDISMDYPQRDGLRALRQEAASVLIGSGFYEAINYSFVAEKHADMLGLHADDPRRNCVPLLNPLSEDQAVMRTMLLPGILENIRRNINFQQTDIRLFEIGKVFTYLDSKEQPSERYQLSAVVSGARYPAASPLYFSDEHADIYDIKGAVQRLLQVLRLHGKSGNISFLPLEGEGAPYADAGCSLRIMDGEEQLGLVGKLSKAAAKAFSIKQDVFFAELELAALMDLSVFEKTFTPLPRYPSVKRDIALLVPENVAAGDLLHEIRSHEKQHVVYADIFDVYSGKPIEEGMKSVALTVTYRSEERTLDDATVDGFHEKIVNALMSRFGGRYREGKG
ncbi:MAG: phenylalanine--tRNA ligase subunit beta [Candidatus Electrothrix aestuarii]|uniref:Phenylalanine--tRNA ligase beta subunit n=1 Tax=Candidatus Electrothrix aestuarii TaxID=3062594 RepID=A0AAU8LUV3_9BACT|nr:phenylalanine--tRNA ligase subunit beta [Candidatus Electrothrix aestuarii]